MYVCRYARLHVRTSNIRICTNVCQMYVCMYVSIYVSMYLCIYVSMYLCIYVSMYLCIYVCMHACMYVWRLQPARTKNTEMNGKRAFRGIPMVPLATRNDEKAYPSRCYV